MGVNKHFRAFVPRYLLERLAQHGDRTVAVSAVSTLEHDVTLRARRRDHHWQTARVAPDRSARRTVYDARGHLNTQGRVARREGDRPVRDAAVNQVYESLGLVLGLLHDVFGRDSLDDFGLPLQASVNYGTSYANAFWDGGQLVLGKGDGEVFTDFARSLDVVGHELGHGLIQYTAGLSPLGQSGVLAESLADVFASLVKQYAAGQTAAEADWLIGNRVLGPWVNGSAVRSMKAPGTAYDDELLGTDPQPAVMDDYIQSPAELEVHVNSGIPNHVFYLVATSLGGRAWERAGQIWYDALTSGRLSPTATIADFARLTAAVAYERYGPGEVHNAIQHAWGSVAVSLGPPGPPFESDDEDD